MAVKNRVPAEQEQLADTYYVLITGANAGLGLATCKRLLDEFIKTRPSSQSIHLLFTTRSEAKSKATLASLRGHIDRNAILKAASNRISLSSYEVDTTNLRGVIELANTLDGSFPYLNVLICNAGIMGVDGIYFGKLMWKALTDFTAAVTWPSYNKHSLGQLARPQFDVAPGGSKEPPLGDVFTANVFGHYILASHLSPLFSRVPVSASPGRIIWTGSVETYAASFSLDDVQCLDRKEAYSSSKRLTDLLALTSELPETQSTINGFYGNVSNRPVMYLSHPGVVATEIMALSLTSRWGKIACFYIARWLGSPWHVISTYKGAVSACWLALSPASTIQGIEARDGKGKWGSATDVFGNERVTRTDVEGWGYGGIVGGERLFGPKGRRRGAVDLTEEQRKAFDKLGVQAWKKMESLRKEWEDRLDEHR